MRILLSGGGTLGSVTPLIAVADFLRSARPDAELLWVGTKEGPERALVERYGIEFRPVAAGRLRRFLTPRNLLTPFRVLSGLRDSLELIRAWKPDVVVSAGGFVSVPLVWAAYLRRVPVHVHQMDWRPGLANRLSAPFARSVSVTFDKSARDFPRTVVTGNPVRREMLSGDPAACRQAFGFSPERPLVLVLGGGTGAMALNELVAGAAPDLCPEVQVLHLTGEGKAVDVPPELDGYRQVEFLSEDFGHAVAAADLVVTRAGMGTLTELAAAGKPAVVVPIPDSHQEENAEAFVRGGAAVYFSEKDGPAALADRIRGVMSDEGLMAGLSSGMSRMNGPDAARRVAELVLALAEIHSDDRNSD